jgi:hypothetical protein
VRCFNARLMIRSGTFVNKNELERKLRTIENESQVLIGGTRSLYVVVY